MISEALRSVLTAIEGYRDEAVYLESELTKRVALGPENEGVGEKDKAEFIAGYLETLGLGVDRYDSPDDRVPCGYRPNLVSVLKGEVEKPALWLLAHTDVVPPGDRNLWTSDPWTVRVDGDRVYGRGVEDNQAGLVSALLAAKAFKETGVTPHLPLSMAFVADEETGSVHGLRYLLESRRELFSKNDLIIIPDSGSSRGTDVEVAEKSILWIKIRTVGKQTHGSVPERGINAHKASAYLTTRLDTLYRRFRKKNSLFEPPGSTFEPTKKEANVPNVNTIPGEDVIYFDCRVLPDYRLRDVIKAVKELAKETHAKYRVRIILEFPQMESAAPPTDPQAPVVRAISAAVKDLRKRRTRPVGIGGGTVAKYFRENGFPCVVWSTMEQRAHSPDEFALVPNILDDAGVFAHVAMQST